MNLFDMLRRKDRNLIIEGEVVQAKATHDAHRWRGLNLAPDASFRIADMRRFVTFRDFAESCGWMVAAPAGTALRVSITSHGGNHVIGRRIFEGAFQPIRIPWPLALPGQVDLLVERLGHEAAPVFVGVHRALSRQWLYDAAIGNGIEIGPGPQPQILPQEGRRVSYLEQMPPEDWNRLYNSRGNFPMRPELWENYIVGDASNLPVDDGALDFLFASHVFEHLANPIGHLKRWRSKLAPGGKIICIVPDLHGTKDAIQERSSFDEWIREFEAHVWEPTEKHYCRHLQRNSGDKHLLSAMEQRQSIHVHYYDNTNCRLLLDYAVTELGYKDFVIEHTPNHKDFHFLLQNQ